MNTIKQFVTGNPGQLSTQLSNLESNVVSETADIRAKFVPIPVTTAVVTSGGGSFSVGEAVIADTTLSTFTLNLTDPVNKAPGFAMLINRSSGNVTLKTIAPTLIQLSASLPFANGMWILFFDGTGWWFK